MKYEIVNLEEKKIVGLTARTSNHDCNVGQVIGGLWAQFHSGFFQGIEGKVNECAIGLYSDYDSDMNGPYDMTVGSEVLNSDHVSKVIPAGKYAKFVVKGHMQEACIDFWKTLWQMDLDRAYTSDFEEYQPGGSMENAEIHMYIALK